MIKNSFGISHGGFGDTPPEYVEPHIKWCKENIIGVWKAMPPYVERDSLGGSIVYLHYTFVFEDDIDAMAFKLRWK